MERLTIFTPTYNRAAYLPRVYQSLLAQTLRDFVWQIVDDGSTDDTPQVVQGFLEEGLLRIQYLRKPNGGKHTAYNYGISKAETELYFVALDSDDTLRPRAVEKIMRLWETADENAMGMVFLCQNSAGQRLVSVFEERELIEARASLAQAFANGWFSGEAEYIFRTEYARRFAYPVFPGERFFTEAYLFLQMQAPMLWSGESIYVRDYQSGGLTDNVLSGFLKNPKSYALYNDLRLHLSPPGVARIKYALYYDMFSSLAGDKGYAAKSSRPVLTRLVLPAAPMAAWLLRYMVERKRDCHGD